MTKHESTSNTAQQASGLGKAHKEYGEVKHVCGRSTLP